MQTHKNLQFLAAHRIQRILAEPRTSFACQPKTEFSCRIKTVLSAFVLLEVLDAALTFFGISQSGLIFEKNLFARSFITSFGFLPIAAIKIGVSAAFAVLINYFYGRFEKYGKMLFYLSVLLMLIAFYGAGSSAYVLLFYP